MDRQLYMAATQGEHRVGWNFTSILDLENQYDSSIDTGELEDEEDCVYMVPGELEDKIRPNLKWDDITVNQLKNHITPNMEWNKITIDQLEKQITPNGNTILHIACQFGQLQFVKMIFAKYDNEIGRLHNELLHTNNKGETPFHLAAGNGYLHIVAIILAEMKKGDRITEILKAMNEDGDTAVHMAMRLWSGEEVVKLLIRADTDIKYPPNNTGETPLYIAIERANSENLDFILEKCTNLDYTGPSGRTVVHAAAVDRHNSGCLSKLLTYYKDQPEVISLTDELGWTPLHYAVCMGFLDSVHSLLESNKSLAYIKAEHDGNQTALHIASRKGFIDLMREILSYCFDIWETVNNDRQNILHIAADAATEESIEFILNQSWSKHLVNQRDKNGNTPIHLIHANDLGLILLRRPNHPYTGYSKVVNNQGLYLWEVPVRKMKQEPDCRKFPYMIGRNIIRDEDDVTQLYGTEYERENLETTKRRMENIKKMADIHLIVAGLVATVTFAVGFTLPGGYEANDGTAKGMAILAKKTMFNVFMVTNTIAMVSSVCAVFLYFTASLYKSGDDQYARYKTAMYFVLVGLGAMVGAFVAGTHAVINNGTGIAIATIIICGLCFLLYILELKSMGIVGYARAAFARCIYGKEAIPFYEIVMENRANRMRYDFGLLEKHA